MSDSSALMEENVFDNQDDSKLKDDNGYSDAQIYCANCSHCVVVKSPTGEGNQYVLRVRCKKKMWNKKLGDEKLYKYHTVYRRVVDECEYYEPTGDPRTFLKELKKTLPIKDEVYTY